MPHRVVIVGSGFGGLFAVRRLKRAPVEVTVIDRTAHHLFQPLLYQVATGILSEGEIAPPMRDVLRRQPNARAVLGEVVAIDLEQRTVTSRALDRQTVTAYDSLIVAAGARTSYFGHDEYAEHAPGLKSIEDALALRAQIFGAFELAEIESDPARRRRWMTFVVVGAGPTGVEMAGQIAELAHRALRENFRAIDPRDARIVLVDAADQVLGQFGGRLPAKAAATLVGLGVELMLRSMVTGVDATGVDLEGPDACRVEAMTKIWAAGVQASPLGRTLAEQAGAEVTRSGQVKVGPDCTLPGHPEVFVVGDLMALDDLPGVAEVAMQSGRHAARLIEARLNAETPDAPFAYHDLGTLASISRYSAVGEIGRLRFWGLLGWVVWLVVHLTFLTGFKNRVSALAHWGVSFVGRSRSERAFSTDLITGPATDDRVRVPATIRALLFDMDGVLTDTAVVHAAAWKQAFDEVRERVGTDKMAAFDARADYGAYVDGRTRLDGVRAFLDSQDVHLDEGEEDDGPDALTVNGVGKRKNDLLLQRLRDGGVDAYPGSLRFVRRAREAGLACAVVSSSANAHEALAAAGMADLFDTWVDGVRIAKEGIAGKPAPDGFLAAAADLGVPVHEAAVLEDALAGVQAGRAGAFGLVVGVDRHGRAAELTAHGADVVVSDLDELELAR